MKSNECNSCSMSNSDKSIMINMVSFHRPRGLEGRRLPTRGFKAIGKDPETNIEVDSMSSDEIVHRFTQMKSLDDFVSMTTICKRFSLIGWFSPDLVAYRRAFYVRCIGTRVEEIVKSFDPCKRIADGEILCEKTDSTERLIVFTYATKSRVNLFEGTIKTLRQGVEALVDLYGDPTEDTEPASQIPVDSLEKFEVFLEQIRDVFDGLVDFSARRQLGEGFDMADMAIWRYCLSFIALLEYRKKPVVNMIQDPKSKSWWTRCFGPTTYSVPRNRFIKMLIRDLPGLGKSASKTETIQLMRFHHLYLNLPRDDYMTTYKFNMFISALGPWDCLLENFRRIVLGPGFAGFINREQARLLISNHFNSNEHHGDMLPLYILRFSRTQPDRLVITTGLPTAEKILVTHRLFNRSTDENNLSHGMVIKILDTSGLKNSLPHPDQLDIERTATEISDDVRDIAYEDTYHNHYETSVQHE